MAVRYHTYSRIYILQIYAKFSLHLEYVQNLLSLLSSLSKGLTTLISCIFFCFQPLAKIMRRGHDIFVCEKCWNNSSYWQIIIIMPYNYNYIFHHFRSRGPSVSRTFGQLGVNLPISPCMHCLWYSPMCYVYPYAWRSNPCAASYNLCRKLLVPH